MRQEGRGVCGAVIDFSSNECWNWLNADPLQRAAADQVHPGSQGQGRNIQPVICRPGQAVYYCCSCEGRASLQVDAISSGQGPSSSGIDFSSNETWNRLNADPLLLIKRNQVNKVQAAVSNPYLVAQIKQQLRAARGEKGDKVSKKKEKKGKKDKKRSKSKRAKRAGDMCVSRDVSSVEQIRRFGTQLNNINITQLIAIDQNTIKWWGQLHGLVIT
jgi:hypothetical protein